ncbi:MAG: periplasmic heavy metal sensor [Nevskia sp.]|nr:periplasmic heavy metal sensor [Nevskia sp.]
MNMRIKLTETGRVIACVLLLLAAGVTVPMASAEPDMKMGGMGMEHGPPAIGAMAGDNTMEPMHSMEDPMGAPAPAAPQAPATADGGSAPALIALNLPGFTGAPGLYHMGATDFFLDHSEHIALSEAQRKSLEALKAATLKEQAGYRRQIEQQEDALWTLTGAEVPDSTAIATKIADIGLLHARQRGGYMDAVGRAGQVLTAEQRKQLTGSGVSHSAAAAQADKPAYQKAN